MDNKVSVIMTSYNGERFVEKQIKSILNNLRENDELLISDDGSRDRTVEIIKEIMLYDKRIIFFDGPHKGLNENIKFLYSKCSGDFIFISDQDDVWHKDKVSKILEYFENNQNVSVIHHNSTLINGDGKSLDKTVYESMSFSTKLFKFVLKSHIFGSMMAFRREMLDYDIIPSKNCYDAGIACYGMKLKKIMFVEDVLMDYRRHENNISSFKRRPLFKIIPERIHLIWFILTKVIRKKKKTCY